MPLAGGAAWAKAGMAWLGGVRVGACGLARRCGEGRRPLSICWDHAGPLPAPPERVPTPGPPPPSPLLRLPLYLY